MSQAMSNNNTTPAPWNKGKLIGQKLSLHLKEIWAVRVRLQLSRNHRDLALFNLATRQYARIVESWVTQIGLVSSAYGTHSMRHTKPTLIYKRTKNLRAVQLLLDHTKLESKVRYLGIEVDDALEIAEQTEI